MIQKQLSLHYSVLWKFISIIMLVAIFNTGSASACFYLAIEYLDSPAYQCHSLNFWKIDLMLNTWLLCTGAELDFGAGVWGEAEKIFFFFLLCQGKEDTGGPWFKNCVPTSENSERSQWFKHGVANREQGVRRACTPLIWPQVVSGRAPMLP